MTKIRGKVIWITGASSGIGKALAVEMAKKGAKLILSARRKEVLEQVKASCEKEGASCEVLALDLIEVDKMEEKTKKALSLFGSIDVLINNGGISQRALVKETPLEIDRKIMEIDYFGTVALTKAVLPYMIAQGSGHIGAVSSIAGKFGFPLRSAYSAAKHAMVGFFETLYHEGKKDQINVTLFYPGRVQTDISVHALEKDGKEHGKMDQGQAGGISAKSCAKKMIRALEKNKMEVYIGGKEILMVYVKRFFPGLHQKIVSRVDPT